MSRQRPNLLRPLSDLLVTATRTSSLWPSPQKGQPVLSMLNFSWFFATSTVSLPYSTSAVELKR